MVNPNEKIETAWGKFDALWLPRSLVQEQARKNLPAVMTGAGSAHAIFITVNDVKVGGANILLAYDYLLIDVFWVQEDRRRQKLGTRILSEIEAFALENGKRRILLSTFEFQSALPFWTSNGFKEVGRIDDYPNGMKLIYMHKRL